MSEEELGQELYDMSDGEGIEVNGFIIMKVGCCYEFDVFRKETRYYKVADDVGKEEVLELVLKGR